MCETQELKMLLIPHFLLAFYELIHLCSNQSLRNLLCFTSRCEDLIRTYPRSKKNLVSDRENFTYWEEPERIEVLTNKCGLLQKKQLGVLGGGSSANPRKLQFLPSFKFENSVSVT